MDYTYDKIKNPKVLKMLFKVSAFSVVACFLALFAGVTNRLAVVYDDSGQPDRQLLLTGNYEKDKESLKKDKEVALGDNDDVTFTQCDGKFSAKIARAVCVNLKVYDSESKEPVVSRLSFKPGQSVEKALDSVGLQLSEHDELLIEKAGFESKSEKDGGLGRNAIVEKGLTEITVKKVGFREYSEQHEIDFKIEKKFDETMNAGDKRTEFEGEKGIVEIDFRSKIMCGEVVGAPQQIGEGRIIKEPRAKIIVEGTKKKQEPSQIVKRQVDPLSGKNESYVEGKRKTKSAENSGKKSGVLYGYATSYDERAGRTTSRGGRVKIGTIAGDPNVTPYGSHMKVFNSKTGTLIYEGEMRDYCPRVVKKRDNVVVDLFGAKIGKVPVKVVWTK